MTKGTKKKLGEAPSELEEEEIIRDIETQPMPNEDRLVYKCGHSTCPNEFDTKIQLFAHLEKEHRRNHRERG
jgi:hypothetical protein